MRSCLVCAAFWSVLRLWVLVPLVEWVQVGSGVVCFKVFGSNSALSKSSYWWGAVQIFQVVEALGNIRHMFLPGLSPPHSIGDHVVL